MNLKAKFKAFICKVKGHDIVATTLSWHQKTAESEWLKITKKGPDACRRCEKMMGPVVISGVGDFTSVEVVPDDVDGDVVWAVDK